MLGTDKTQNFLPLLNRTGWAAMIVLIFISGLLYSSAAGYLTRTCSVSKLSVIASVNDKVVAQDSSHLEITAISGDKIAIETIMIVQPQSCLYAPSLEWDFLPSSDVNFFTKKLLIDKVGEKLEYIGRLDSNDATVVEDKILISVPSIGHQPSLPVEVNIYIQRNKQLQDLEQ